MHASTLWGSLVIGDQQIPHKPAHPGANINQRGWLAEASCMGALYNYHEY